MTSGVKVTEASMTPSASMTMVKDSATRVRRTPIARTARSHLPAEVCGRRTLERDRDPPPTGMLVRRGVRPSPPRGLALLTILTREVLARVEISAADVARRSCGGGLQGRPASECDILCRDDVGRGPCDRRRMAR